MDASIAREASNIAVTRNNRNATAAAGTPAAAGTQATAGTPAAAGIQATAGTRCQPHQVHWQQQGRKQEQEQQTPKVAGSKAGTGT